MRDIIHGIMETSLGRLIKTGEFRKNPTEPAQVYPSGYEYGIIGNGSFKMEYLEPEGVVIRRVVLQLHGGDYIGPMKDTYRKSVMHCSHLSFGRNVPTVDYRAIPENPHPAAPEDAIHAYRWLVRGKRYRPGQIVVVGDSAEGSPALAPCLYLRNKGLPQPVGLALMPLWADVTCNDGNYELSFQKGPLFGNIRESMSYGSSCVGDMNPKDLYLSSVLRGFRGLSIMLLQAGSPEMLLSDTLSVAEKAREAGVRRRVSVYEEMFHVFQMSMDLIPKSREAWDEVARSIQIMLWIDRKPEGRVVRKVKRTNKTRNEG